VTGREKVLTSRDGASENMNSALETWIWSKLEASVVGKRNLTAFDFILKKFGENPETDDLQALRSSRKRRKTVSDEKFAEFYKKPRLAFYFLTSLPFMEQSAGKTTDGENAEFPVVLSPTLTESALKMRMMTEPRDSIFRKTGLTNFLRLAEILA
jgi:hypothetical protein